MSTQETHCLHLHTVPNQARAVVRDSGKTVHYCAPCMADKLTAMLRHNGPAKVARSIDFKYCPHRQAGARRCLICWYGVAGALLLCWSVVRSQTNESNTEANRLMRLLEVIGLYHGPVFGRLGIPYGAAPHARTEAAILPTNHWEKRDHAATT